MNINLKKIVIIAVVELTIILSTVAVTAFVVKTKEAIPTPKEILTTNTFSDQKKLETIINIVEEKLKTYKGE